MFALPPFLTTLLPPTAWNLMGGVGVDGVGWGGAAWIYRPFFSHSLTPSRDRTGGNLLFFKEYICKRGNISRAVNLCSLCVGMHVCICVSEIRALHVYLCVYREENGVHSIKEPFNFWKVKITSRKETLGKARSWGSTLVGEREWSWGKGRAGWKVSPAWSVALVPLHNSSVATPGQNKLPSSLLGTVSQLLWGGGSETGGKGTGHNL